MMAHQHLGAVLRHFRGVIDPPGGSQRTDRQLLESFALQQDETAFATLVRRHGAMVLGVCRRFVGHAQDAEDAFQATFLVLAQKANSVRWHDSVGHWLHEVAYRIALRTRTAAARRRALEKEALEMAKPEPTPKASWRALCLILDEELHLLPQKYRAPLVLCHLEGMAQAAAASHLGCSEATLNRRLAEGRARLRVRLARRGITLSAALLAVGLSHETASAAVSSVLAASTVRVVILAAAGKELAGVPATVLSLAGSAAQSMTSAKVKLGATVLIAIGLLAGAGLVAYQALAARPVEQPSKDAGAGSAFVDPSSGGSRVAQSDPLPDGALARLGSVRLQQDDGIFTLAFAPDGKTLVTGGRYFGGMQRLLRGGDNVIVIGDGGLRGQRGAPFGTANSITFWDAASGKEIRKLDRGLPGVMKLAFSADGKNVLSFGLDAVTGQTQGLVRISELATGKELSQVKFNGMRIGQGGVGVEFSPDGKTIATGYTTQEKDNTTKGFIQLWEIETGNKIDEWSSGKSTSTLAFSPDGKLLASTSAGKDSPVRLWDVETRKEMRLMDGTDGYGKLTFSPDGKLLAATGPGNFVTLWDAANGKQLHKLEGHTAAVSQLAFSPDGKQIASLGADKAVRLWSSDSGKLLYEWNIPVQGGTPMAFSADGKMLAVGISGADSMRGMVRLFDTASGQEVGPKARSHSALRRVACSGDGKIVATAGKDDVIRLWEADTGKEIRSFAAENGGIASLVLTPDGKKLVTIGQDGTVRVRDAVAGKEIAKFECGAEVPIQKACFSPDGKFLLAAGAKGEVVLCNVETAKVLRSFKSDNAVSAVAICPDGRRAAIASNGKIRVWDASTGKVRSWKKKREVLAPGDAQELAFSPDGHYLVSSHPQAVRIWELASGEIVEEIKSTGATALSPEGRTLAVLAGNQVRLLDLTGANELPTLTGHQWGINSVAFSLDGKRLISVSDDTTGLVWDAARLIPATKSIERSKHDLKVIWDNLADDEEAVAYRATWDLAHSAPAAIALLRERLRPVPIPPDAKRIDGFIADLDSEEFDTRKAAYEELDELGATAEAAIRRALKSGPALESRRQLEKLLSKVDRMSVERLRQLRVIVALERAGSQEARKLLQSLAEGEPGAWLTEEAKSALERLDARWTAAP